MTTKEAKEALWLYRGPIDDADPKFQEALAYARRDPELTKWLHEQRTCFEAIRSKLRDIEPPHALAENLISHRPIPFRHDLNRILQLAAAIVVSASLTAVSMKLWERKRDRLAQGQEIIVTGEVLDMTCYIASNLSGPEHAVCARECIKSGLPAGLKAGNGKVYLLTGQPGQPVNAQLAELAAKIVTIKGKETTRDGFAQLQIEEISKTLTNSQLIKLTKTRLIASDEEPSTVGASRNSEGAKARN
jgi:hypothetical protein